MIAWKYWNNDEKLLKITWIKNDISLRLPLLLSMPKLKSSFFQSNNFFKSSVCATHEECSYFSDFLTVIRSLCVVHVAFFLLFCIFHYSWMMETHTETQMHNNIVYNSNQMENKSQISHGADIDTYHQHIHADTTYYCWNLKKIFQILFLSF